jgi:O-antigen ligase
VIAAFGGTPAPARISLAPSETTATALLVLAYGAAFFAAVRLLQTRARRRVFLAAVVASAFVQVGLGIASAEAQEIGRLHGPFVNPDHFAGYLELPLAVAFAALWMAVRMKTGRREDGLERRLAAVSAAVLLWGTLAAAVGLTHSRGGILAALFAAAVMLALSIVRHRKRASLRSGWAGLAVLAAGLVFAALITREGPLLRFLADDPRDIGADMRVRIWSTSIEAFRRSPIAGTGLGTFRDAFRHVQPAGLEGLVEQAHDDLLQLLVTGGLVAGLLGAAGFLAAGRGLLQGWARQQHREERALALSAFGALLSLTLHGVVDFSLSIPAVAVTLAAVVGMGWVAGRSSIEARTISGAGPASG